MSRKRVITEAMERILVMAQLSGVTPEDLAFIGNRIRRDRERNDKKHEIEQAAGGWVCKKEGYRHYSLISPKGIKYEINESTRKGKHYSSDWEVTKFDKAGNVTHTAYHGNSDWAEAQFPKYMYPAKSQMVYTVINKIQSNGLNWDKVVDKATV